MGGLPDYSYEIVVYSSGYKDNVTHALAEQDFSTPENGKDDPRSSGMFSLSEV